MRFKLLSWAGVMFAFLALPVVTLAQSSISESTLLLVPTNQTGQESVSPGETPDGSNESYLVRTGTVSLSVDTLLPKSSDSKTGSGVDEGVEPPELVGQVVVFSPFTDREFRVVVASEERPRPGVLMLRGRLEGVSLQNVSLTITSDAYLMTIGDDRNKMVYRIKGSSRTGKGEVRQLDSSKMPRAIPEEPLVPEERNRPPKKER